MNKSYYPKLAVSNLKKNRQVYFPFVLAAIATVAMFFIMQSLAKNEGLKQLDPALEWILIFGTYVIAIFSVILLFYTNSFLIKRRKKEIGLYNILGMEKKHIAVMMSFETLFIYGISTGIGLILGLVLNKLMFLLLLKLLSFTVSLTFSISFVSIKNTILLFAGIFLATFLFNLFQIHLAKPVELLSADKSGEKEPKGKLVLTLIGLALLACGYAIAIITKNPLDAISLFFLAVLMVIAGTYLLFTTGSITLLKFLKRNKNYYYKTEHFISTSSMIYRMKQNAVGLASICILSTAVLLILSTTVSLYMGENDILKTRYPRQFSISVENPTAESYDTVTGILDGQYDRFGVEPENIIYHSSTELVGTRDEASFYFTPELDETDMDKIVIVDMIPVSEYNRLTGKNISLNGNEVLIYQYKSDFSYPNIKINDDVYRNVGSCSDITIVDTSYADYYGCFCIVFSDSAQILTYYNNLNQTKDTALELKYQFDLSGNTDHMLDFSNDTRNVLCAMEGISVESRDLARNSFYLLYGSLFFIGIFLGSLFLGATILIIYYKQISEGFDDRKRYRIMEKVGLSKTEVKKSIHSQILKIFFLPLVMAVIHIAFAFKLITQLLFMLGFVNTSLFLLCTVATIAVFAVIYSAVYWRTAKTYYKIVE